MTDGELLDPDGDGVAPADPDDGEPAEGASRRDGLELLALLVLVGVVGVMGQALFTGLSFAEIVGADPGSPSRWSAVLNFATQGGSVITAGLVALALGLVLLAPGPVGRRGQTALKLTAALGVLVATLAVLGIEEALRNRGGGMGALADTSGPGHSDLYGKIAALFAWLPAIGVAGFAAFAAWRTLGELDPPPEPDERDEA